MTIGDAPPRPAPTDQPGEQHDAYAAYMLGVLFADWDWRARVAAANGSPWRALAAWEAEPDDSDAREITRRIINNMDDVSAARRRIRRTAR